MQCQTILFINQSLHEPIEVSVDLIEFEPIAPILQGFADCHHGKLLSILNNMP